jgi:hypothetical protein
MEGSFVDPIVEEIRKIRDEHAARFNYDIDAIWADMKRRQDESGIPVVSLPPKRIPVAGNPPDETAGPLSRAS